MTSVKELGETLRKQRPHLDPEEEVDEEEAGVSPSGAAYSALLVVAGCLALGVGAFLASSLVIAPELAWIADSLQRMGITSGAVLAGGVSLLGLSLVCKAIARAHRSLSGSMRSENGLSAVTDSQADLRDGLDKVQFELRVLHESTRQLLEIAHEQTLKRSSNHPDDAVLQLAASLDQLGARLEDRLETQHTGINERLGSLDGSLEETRRRLTSFVEDSRRNGQAKNESPSAPAAGDKRRRPTERPSRRPRHEPSEPEGDDDLHVLVTLEERDEEVHKAQRNAATSLGLLDELGDFSDLGGPPKDFSDLGGSPKEAPSPFSVESRGPSPDPLLQAQETREKPEPSDAKLEQLKSLLADQGLRKALEDLRREGKE